MNSRINNFSNYYENNNPRFGYSNVSKGFGLSTRNPLTPEDQNVGQLQFMLQNQRKKFREEKDRLENELDSERKVRIQFQNKLIKVKDQFSRRDISTSELEFKINNLLHQNQDVVIENDRLKHQIARMEEVYGSKIQQLQAQLKMQNQNFEETTFQYNSEFQKFKKEGQQYVEQLTFQFQRKIKSIEEKNKSLQIIKKDLSMENKKLNEIIISNKISFEEEIRDIKNRARDQDVKRLQQINRSFEQKIKMIEDSKEILVRKNQQLLRTLQEKQRAVSDLQGQKQAQIERLRQDCTDLSEQNNHLNYLFNKVKQQLAEKECIVGRSFNENDTEVKTLKQQLQLKKQENAQQASNVREVRSNWKQAENDWERKKRELLERQSALENEARKYKDEYLRICEILKSKINSAIDNVSFKK